MVQLAEAPLLVNWQSEARLTGGVVAILLCALLGLARVYRWRVVRWSAERDVGVQDLHNQKYALDQHAIVSMTDIGGRITYANDRFCAISGFARDELLGNTHQRVKSDAHGPDFYAALWATITQGRVWHAELCNRSRNGAIYWVSASIVPLLGVDGKVQQYIAIQTDISDRKAIEHSLGMAKETAEHANRAKSQFLANMSHEIRTQMNGILGLLTLLQRTALSPTQHEWVAKTETAARALLALLNDILDFSKIEAGKMQLDLRPFSLRQLLHDVEVILQGNMADKALRLVLDVAPDLPDAVCGDDMRLQQVLLNLGGNAIKFTERGEVRLEVRARCDPADVPQPAVRLEFCVRDTGIGISEAQQRQIFDGFSQAETSTTRRYGGSGLGLSISRQLVRLMGGDIAVQSTVGVGSVFSFAMTLPLVARAPTAPTAPAAAANGHPVPSVPSVSLAQPANKVGRLAGLRILVVEDNKINQLIAQTLLEQELAEVTLADNGALGVAAVQAANPPFAAVLMDLQMPVMDGFDATRALRRLPQGAHLPIIALTANAMPADRLACLEAGMNEHIGKPFQIDHLVDMLRQQVTAAGPAESALLDEAGALDRLANSAALYHTVLEPFIADLAKTLPDVASALQSGDHAAAARTLHTLKGLSATVGATALSAQAMALEREVKTGQADPASVLARLEAEIARVAPLLADAVRRYDPASQPGNAI